MDKFIDGFFYSPTAGSLTLEGMMAELCGYMTASPDKVFEITVGCDSPSSDEPFFPLAVVILKKGEGGRFFLKKIHYSPFEKRFYSWRQRILEEVYLSCEFALLLRERLLQAPELKAINYDFRYIHADIGEQGKTKEMVKEVTGFITANGFEPKIKPYSYAASAVADRYT